MKVLMLSGIMYGGAWRRNYNVLKAMRKVDRRIDYTLVLDASLIRLVPDIEEAIAELKELYQLRFITTPRQVIRLTPSHYIYMSKLSKIMKDIAKKEKVDLLFVPHEVDWWILSARNASENAIPWTSLFQTGPFFGCILKPSPRGALSTLMETPAIAYRRLKKLRGIYRFSRLQLLARALEETLSLSVSKSVTRDLRILFPWLNIATLTPGVGIDLAYISSIPTSSSIFDVIYFTSELIPHKGFFDIPVIWKNVVQEMPEARLLVVGRAQQEARRQFLELLEKLDLKRNIVLHDLLPHHELISLVKASKAMIYPSRFDAFPLVVMESLASGIPVVAYDIPAVRLNYVTSSVVKCLMGDAKGIATNVVDVLCDDTLRKNLSEEAVKYAARFSWQNVAREEAKAYSKVLDFWSSR